MSTDSDELGEEEEKEHASAAGEGVDEELLSYKKLVVDEVAEVIPPKVLTFREASTCLHMLGKDESGCRYALLMITAENRQLTDISVVLQFGHLLFLDVGGNTLDLEALQILAKMPYLIYLKADSNRVESVELKVCSLLQVLILSRNKINSTQRIRQPLLECLDLNYNYIDYVDLKQQDIPRIKLVELRGNFLNSLTGNFPVCLDSLYLAENRIETLDWRALDTLVNLRILHLRDNIITKLDGFSSKMKKLKYLNIRRNRIAKLRDIGKLGIVSSLETLIMMQNPVSGDSDEQRGEGAADADDVDDADDEDEEELGEGEEPLDKFRVKVLILLPHLKRLNKKIVGANERVAADLQRSDKYDEIMGEHTDDENEEELEDTTMD